jgi:flagellar basal-body rod modification protein FlgD
MTISGTQSSTSTEAAVPVAAKQADMGKETFLKLLIAQIRHQDPMNPADGLQFITQLAQFSELEQVMEIRKDLQVIREQYELTAESSPAGGNAGN